MAYYSGGGGNPPPRRPPPYPLRDTWMRSPPDWPNNSAPSQLAPHPRTPDPDSEIYENIYDSRWRLLNQVRKGQKIQETCPSCRLVVTLVQKCRLESQAPITLLSITLLSQEFDECLFAKNGRIISIQFSWKKKRIVALICWASSLRLFFLLLNSCFVLFVVVLCIRLQSRVSPILKGLPWANDKSRASLRARKLSLVMKRRLMMGFVWKVPHEWPPKRPIKTLGREIEQIRRRS